MTKQEKKDLRATRQLCLSQLYDSIEERLDSHTLLALMDVYERLYWIEANN